MFSELFLCSNIVLLCAFAVFIQIATMVRPLLFARQPLWKYALAVLALLLSLSSFVIAIHAMSVEQSFFTVIGMHLSHSYYIHLQAQLSSTVSSCMVQIYLLVIMLVLLWYVKSISKPRPVPAWVIAQDIRGRL